MKAVNDNEHTVRAKTTSSERLRTFLRVCASIIMCLFGVIIIQKAVDTGVGQIGLVQSLGIALIIAGIVSTLREALLAPLTKADTKESFDDISRKIDNVKGIVNESERKINTLFNHDDTGMKIIRNERLGFSGYHKWIVDTDALEMFFAGRSVLHRMEKDFSDRNVGSVPDAFMNHMRLGSRIRILFLDPTWDILDQIASQEGRPNPLSLYNDLKTSLFLVKNLWDSLNQLKGSFPGSIDIRVYDTISQYAFHRVCDNAKDKVEMFVGFYFADMLGWQSALFDVNNKNIQTLFERHFSLLFDRAREVLTYPRHGGGLERFDQSFFTSAMNHIDAKMQEHTKIGTCAGDWDETLKKPNQANAADAKSRAAD